MGEGERAVQAAAVARHPLEEVFRRLVELQLHQCGAALVDAVHRQGLDPFYPHLLRHRSHALGDAAALGEDASVEGGVVERGLFQRGDVDMAGIEECLQLFKGEDAVDAALRFGQLVLQLFAGAGTDKDDLAGRVGALDEQRRLHHRRYRMRDVFDQVGEVLFHKHDEGRAARSGEHPLLLPFLCLVVEGDVCAQRRLYDLVEAELAHARDHLFDLGVLELADDGGGDDRVDVVFGVVFRFL